MVVTAKVKVNTERVEGSIGQTGSDRILKSILGEFKGMNRILQKAMRINRSGLGGRAGGRAGGLGALLEALGLTIGGLTIGGLSAALGGLMTGDTSTRYAKTQVDGKNMIGGFDPEGKLLDLYTEEEATQRGILNKKGEIDSKLRMSVDELESIFGEEKLYKNTVVLTNDEALKILDEQKSQYAIDKQITEAKRRQLEIEQSKANMTPSNANFMTASGEAVYMPPPVGFENPPPISRDVRRQSSVNQLASYELDSVLEQIRG